MNDLCVDGKKHFYLRGDLCETCYRYSCGCTKAQVEREGHVRCGCMLLVENINKVRSAEAERDEWKRVATRLADALKINNKRLESIDCCYCSHHPKECDACIADEAATDALVEFRTLKGTE